MSTRNQQNYSKVSPMPATASQMEDIRNAVIRRNMYKGSPDLDEANNRKNKSNNVTVYKETRRHSDNGYWPNDSMNRGKVKQINKSDLQQYRGCVSYENVRQSDLTSRRIDNRSGCSVTSEKSRTDTSPEVAKPFSRPKSARPESRWQRRDEDLGDDDELPVFISDSDSDDKSSKSDERPMSERPMSARPDSRLARHQPAATVVNQSNIKPNHQVNQNANQSTDLPPRPKTSHGRHTPESMSYKEYYRSNNESKQKTTSKNSTTKDGWKFDPNAKWQRHEQSQEANNYTINISKAGESKNTLHEMNVYSLTDNNNRVHNADRAHATNQTFVYNKLSLSAIDKKLFGPGDDIDLDVDPVEFFYTPDTTEQSPCPTKSLSKGVINLINESSSDSVQYRSNHGNNQTKRTINPDANERFHGNSVYSPKTVMGNQGSSSTVQARRTMESINTRSNQTREGSGGSFKKKIPLNPETRVVSLNTGERIHMDFPFKHGQKKKDTRITAISRQQPRKLKPLSTLQNGME